MFAVCNSRMVGGGRLCLRAVIDDGLFDVCALEMPTLPGFIRAITRVSSSSDHSEDERCDLLPRPRTQIQPTDQVNTDWSQTDYCDHRLRPSAARFSRAGDAPFYSAEKLTVKLKL